MIRWGKAGVPLDPRERDRRRERVMRTRAFRQQHNAEARARWQSGQLVPDRITCALDLRKLHGPDVDTACKAAEPDVDQWEAGDLYPSWEQVCALAELTQFPVSFFFRPAQEPLDYGSLRFHLPNVGEPRDPVRQFSPAALAWAAAEHGITT